jgi:hypothetical protein
MITKRLQKSKPRAIRGMALRAGETIELLHDNGVSAQVLTITRRAKDQWEVTVTK